MLKKTAIAIVAVMATAPLASAVYQWDAPDTALPGENVRVALYTDETGTGGFGDFKLNVSAGSYVSDSAGTDQSIFVIIPFGAVVTDLEDGFDLQIVGSNLSATSVGELFFFEFTMPNEATTIHHFNGNINNQAVSIEDKTIGVIPEPMTMGLLGLGGLFLRKRFA